MRILITADPEIEVPPRLYGGIERIVDGLVRSLRARGHQVSLVAKPGSQCEADALYQWPGASSLSRSDTLANTWALWRAVRAFRPDMTVLMITGYADTDAVAELAPGIPVLRKPFYPEELERIEGLGAPAQRLDRIREQLTGEPVA